MIPPPMLHSSDLCVPEVLVTKLSTMTQQTAALCNTVLSGLCITETKKLVRKNVQNRILDDVNPVFKCECDP